MSFYIMKLEQIISLKCDWGCDFTTFRWVILIYLYTQTSYQEPQEIYKRREIYKNIGDSRNKFIRYFFIIWLSGFEIYT